MAARDIYHDTVKNALINDGWTITADPLSLPWGATKVEVDLGAERVIAAEKASRKIAVEIKSFVSRSRTEDLEEALGQIVLYRFLLRENEPDRELHLAIREDVFQNFLTLPHVAALLKAEQVRLIVFDPQTEEILQWIS